VQQIELDDQTARSLAAQAAARGMTIIQYLQALAPQVPISEDGAAPRFFTSDLCNPPVSIFFR